MTDNIWRSPIKFFAALSVKIRLFFFREFSPKRSSHNWRDTESTEEESDHFSGIAAFIYNNDDRGNHRPGTNRNKIAGTHIYWEGSYSAKHVASYKDDQ